MNPAMKKPAKTRQVNIGGVTVGGDAPVRVQSMTKTDTSDISATVKQMNELADAGCEIGRCAIPNQKAAEALSEIVEESKIPIVADIHFRHTLALKALRSGVQGMRINPGNIGSREDVQKVVEECAKRDVPIRIGVNSGSVEEEFLDKFGGPTPKAMVESALKHISILESLDFKDIKVSIKASDVERTLRANRILSDRVDYPLHIGITEAGTPFSGTIKSSVGIGIMLHEGIGDTVRISLTGNPVKEVETAYLILRSLGLREYGPEVISCPTCGRLRTGDVQDIAEEIEKRAAGTIDYPLKLAVMGCEVNGPGESREADLGICMGKNSGTLYRRGEKIRRIEVENIVEEFITEAKELAEELKNDQ